MEKKIQAMSVMFLFALSIISGIFIPTVSASSGPEIPEYEPIDIGPSLRENALSINLDPPSESLESGHHSYFAIGDFAIWFWADFYTEFYYLSWYQLRAIGTHAEIWVNVDLSWDPGDPEDPNPRDTPIILDEQIDYLLAEFDTNIYPTTTSYFGDPDPHSGNNAVLDQLIGLPSDYYYEENGRNVILVSNIGDENYYDYTYPYFVAGFYSSTFEYYFDRNIISMDSWQWWRRIGPEGTEWEPGKYVERPYDYESLIAHEYQHLIHDDYNPEDPSFMNEGCSMFAEILCNYPVPWGHINSFLATPDNSLTVWEDQTDINVLADYGAAALWAIYLNDRFGPTFLKNFVQAGIPGIPGLEAAFHPLSFENVHHDWKIANLIHTNKPGNGIYNYKTIDLGSSDAIPIRAYDVSGFPVPWTMGTDFGNTITILDYDTGVDMIGPYGSDYIAFDDWDNNEATILFDGDDIAIYGWTLTADGWWWSGEANLLNTLLYGEAYVDTADPILTIYTSWDIESEWDFGFIQVSTDDGETWTSLSNEYTTSEHAAQAHPDIIANLPGLTYSSGGWIPMSFNLEDYAGDTVLIGFRYMTDWYTFNSGWNITDVRVSGEPLELSVIYPDAEFQVTIVQVFQKNMKFSYKIRDMNIKDMKELSNIGFRVVSTENLHSVVLVVTPTMPNGFTDYKFSMIPDDEGWDYFWDNSNGNDD